MKREDVLKFYADEVEEIKNAGLLKGESPDHVSSGGKRSPAGRKRSHQYVCE